MKFSGIVAALSGALAAAQQSVDYTDTKSGITFQAFFDPPTGYTFGVALPQTPTTDFIGLLTGAGSGWTGVSLGGAMANNLLIAAWPSGKNVLSSFRKVAGYTPPPEVTGTFKITPIANGTYVNSTHYSLTFLCQNCIQTDGTTFTATDTTPVLGWALSTKAPAQPANHSTALNRHENQGNYAIDLTKAKSAKYATWAGYAKAAKNVSKVFVA